MLLKKKHLFSGNGLANANREEKRISEEAVILHGAPTLAGIKTGSLFRCEYESIDPASIRHILITHQDTDHVGALETDSEQLFKDAAVYIGEIENRYLTGEVRRKVMHKLYKLPPVKMNNQKVLLQDGQVLNIERIGPKNTRKVIQIAVSKSYRNRDVHAHQLRHTFITMCHEAGVDVKVTQEIAGHADIHTTLMVYTHLTNAKREEGIRTLNAHLKSKDNESASV